MNMIFFSFFFFSHFYFTVSPNGDEGYVAVSSVCVCAAIEWTAPKSVHTLVETHVSSYYISFLFGIFNVERPTSRYFIQITEYKPYLTFIHKPGSKCEIL